MNTSTRILTDEEFDDGFHRMMSSALEYESLMSKGKSIPMELQQRLDESSDWLNNLSDEDYSRPIH